MSTLAMPLPLPRSIQEMILAKLPVEDLIRSRAVCKFWGRITTTKSFFRRYGPRIGCSRPWFLFIHSRTGFIIGNDVTGKPRRFRHDPWIPTSTNISIISTSRGLFLVLDMGHEQQVRFTVVNPLLELTKELPVLKLSSDQEIVYSKILYSRDDESYKVFTMGVMNSDKQSGLLYQLNFAQPANSTVQMPPNMSEYKKPFMHVYCSKSNSWSAITSGFPRGLMLPFKALTKAHQSFMDPMEGILYCVVNNSDQEGVSFASKLARFDTRKMEWNPVMITLPEKMMLQCMMIDLEGKLQLVLACKETMKFFKAEIRENKVVIGEEIGLPGEMLPENVLMFGMMDVWGFGDALFLHVPVIQEQGRAWDLSNWDGNSLLYQGGNVYGEPRVRFWLFNLRNHTYFCDKTPGVELPVGAYITGAAELLKMVYTPSVCLP